MATRNKTFRLFLLVLTAIITVGIMTVLSACDKEEEAPKKDAVEFLTDVLSEFNSRKSGAIDGKVTIANEEKIVEATYDKVNKVIDLTYGDNLFHYADSFLLLKRENGYSVKEINTNFTHVMKSIPFNLSVYHYNADHVYAVEYDGDNLLITFYKLGVVRSFNSDLDVSGGTFTIIIEDGKAVASVLSTVITVNGQKKKYVAEYHYGVGAPASDVTVIPSDDVKYAAFALDAITMHNPNKTVHSVSPALDMGVNIKAFPLDADKIERVFCIKIDNYVDLTIIYSEPVLIEMVHSSIETVKISFDENYSVSQIVINNANRYNLS